jgi:hypothetical protein
MNGNGMPVTGSSAVTYPMLITACPQIHTVAPPAASRTNGSALRREMRMPVNANSANSARTATHPSRPSSSPITEKT